VQIYTHINSSVLIWSCMTTMIVWFPFPCNACVGRTSLNRSVREGAGLRFAVQAHHWLSWGWELWCSVGAGHDYCRPSRVPARRDARRGAGRPVRVLCSAGSCLGALCHGSRSRNRVQCASPFQSGAQVVRFLALNTKCYSTIIIVHAIYCFFFLCRFGNWQISHECLGGPQRLKFVCLLFVPIFTLFEVEDRSICVFYLTQFEAFYNTQCLIWNAWNSEESYMN
jgi:hypothetical protein